MLYALNVDTIKSERIKIFMLSSLDSCPLDINIISPTFISFIKQETARVVRKHFQSFSKKKVELNRIFEKLYADIVIMQCQHGNKKYFQGIQITI